MINLVRLILDKLFLGVVRFFKNLYPPVDGNGHHDLVYQTMNLPRKLAKWRLTVFWTIVFILVANFFNVAIIYGGLKEWGIHGFVNAAVYAQNNEDVKKEIKELKEEYIKEIEQTRQATNEGRVEFIEVTLDGLREKQCEAIRKGRNPALFTYQIGVFQGKWKVLKKTDADKPLPTCDEILGVQNRGRDHD